MGQGDPTLPGVWLRSKRGGVTLQGYILSRSRATPSPRIGGTWMSHFHSVKHLSPLLRAGLLECCMGNSLDICVTRVGVDGGRPQRAGGRPGQSESMEGGGDGI